MTDVETKPVPSQQFLLMMIVQLRQCEKQTGMSLVEWLENLEEKDDDMNADAYNDASLIKEIRKIVNELYPDEKKA
jgi:hypothetical protein